MRSFALLCVLLGAIPAYAAGWRLDGNLLPATAKDRLAERYPDIRDADELTELLRDIGRRKPMRKLDARLENGVWVVSGEAATVVTDIEIEMTTRLLRTPVSSAVQSYIGTADSPESRAKIVAVAKDYLKRRGYPEADAKLDATPSDGGVEYLVKVDENDPCVIGRLELGFKLPAGVRLGVAPGDICDLEEIERAVSDLELELRDRGYNQLRVELADVRYDAAKDVATIYVAGVLGQRVRYEVVDATHRFLIDDLFQDKELTNVDPTIVGPDAMGAELVRRYRNRGFVDVSIRGPEVEKGKEDEFVYVFYVDPGKQYLLKGVQFEGITAFTEEDVLETIGLKSIWQTARPVNFEELGNGLQALRVRYQEAGYWDAQVRDPGTGQREKETGSVRLMIQVQEGARRLLRSVRFTGAKAVPESELRALLEALPGDPLDRAKLVDFQQDVRKTYIAKGYLYADAKIELSGEPGKREVQVDVTVNVQEGTRVKVGDVSVTGLTRTKEKVVRRELQFERGDWYDPEKINASRLALTRLGLFRSVQIVPIDRKALVDKAAELDLVVDVQEGRAGNVSFGPGWSLQRGWNYGAEASYSNIGGVGRKASVRGQISEEKNQEAIGNKTLVGRSIGTGYTEPYLFDWPVDLAVKANQKAEWGGNLWELSYGGELEFIHTLRTLVPGARISAYYAQEVEKTEGTETQENALIASDVRIGSVGTRYAMDERNDTKFPTDGYTFNAKLSWAEYGLGGDLRYFKWDTGTNVYFGILDDLVFAVGASIQSYENIERKGARVGVLPPTRRLYSGGTETVRGFPSRHLGPVVSQPVDCGQSYTTNYVNGSSRTTISNELIHRINESFAVSGFVDSGNVFLSKDQIKKFSRYYEENPVVFDGANCPNGQPLTLNNSVQENYSYEYRDLLQNPGYLWSRHYYSYGISGSMLTPLGAFNAAYGLPWREPKDPACTDDPSKCTVRAKTSGHWLKRGELYITVGARF
jgi:outer membrane protein insertion porin family